ncbi:MAG: hypothetical protein V3T72_06670 [Thermoanaerobaculia bacterium]
MGRTPTVEIGQLNLRLPGSGETGRDVASRLGPLLGERLATAAPTSERDLRLDSLRIQVPQPPGGGEAETAAAVADAVAAVIHRRDHA